MHYKKLFYICRVIKTKQLKLTIMKLTTEQIKNIKQGDKITFTMYGSAKTFTRKVQDVVTRPYNDIITFNVNKVGSGTGYTGVEAEDILEVK